jgi:diguanylate cyclase (GGDEF)-like protein
MRNVEQTLFEQMKFSDREIEKRMGLFEMTDEDSEILRSCRPLISERLDWVIEEFYARQIDDPEIALIIGDAETLSRLKGSMRNYIVELFNGVYDQVYVNSRLRVGKVHWRIGVTPKFFLSALRRLFGVLCAVVEESSDSPIEFHRRKEAILKVLFFDSQLVFDTYINAISSEVTAAQEETAQYAENLEDQIALRTKQLEKLTLTDDLTGVLNKRAFRENAQREITAARHAGTSLTLLFIDLNSFKLLNDTLGHQAGDDLLCNVAKLLKLAARGSDIVCRVGGDEFCVIMPDAGRDAAVQLGQRFSQLADESSGTPISASIGVAVTGPREYCTVDELIKQSDDSMYKAKERAKSEQDGSFSSIKSFIDEDAVDVE